MMPSPPGPVFVDLAQTRTLLRRGGARLVDARASRAFEEGHLPDAVPWAARDLNPTVEGVRRLTPPEPLASALHARGLGTEPIVIYGSRGGADAAHLWWTLRTYGHPAAYLLDGGVEAWQRAGLPLEGAASQSDRTAPAPATPFAPRRTRPYLVERPELQRRLQDDRLHLLDTRDASEYTGELAAAARGGRVPGAAHFDWREALTGEGLLKPEAELRDALATAMAAPEVVTYCQSGVRAAHTHAVLTHLGHPNVRLYLASWGEWGNRDDTPVKRTHAQEVHA